MTKDTRSQSSATADVRAPEAQAGTPQLLSPLDHAKAIGAYKNRKLGPGAVAVSSINGQTVDLSDFSWQHNAAAALHGWSEHEHHEGGPILLTSEQYRKALLAATQPVTRAAADFSTKTLSGKRGDEIDSAKAAEFGVPTTTDYEPHVPALSKHAAHTKATPAEKA